MRHDQGMQYPAIIAVRFLRFSIRKLIYQVFKNQILSRKEINFHDRDNQG